MRTTNQKSPPQRSSSPLIYMSFWILAAGAAIAYITTLAKKPTSNSQDKYAAFKPGNGISKTEKQLKHITTTLEQSNQQLGKLNNNYYVLDTKIGNLQHAIRQLDQQKSTLTTKVSQIEETLGSVTGAIGPKPKKDNKKTPQAKKQQVAISTTVLKAKPQRSAIPLPILRRQHKNSPPQLSHTQFALELGDYASIKKLKSTWAHYASKHASALGPLKPRYVTIVVNNRPRYKLISGPLRNALDAAKICYHLQQSNINCQQTIYHGSDI